MSCMASNLVIWQRYPGELWLSLQQHVHDMSFIDCFLPCRPPDQTPERLWVCVVAGPPIQCAQVPATHPSLVAAFVEINSHGRRSYTAAALLCRQTLMCKFAFTSARQHHLNGKGTSSDVVYCYCMVLFENEVSNRCLRHCINRKHQIEDLFVPTFQPFFYSRHLRSIIILL